MHILNHGFGQRRKSSHSRPRDLQIRKISFSGSSLSSGCSLSSSTSSTPVATPARTPTTASKPDMDPLHLHPSFHAPPRLFDRPYKDTTPVPVFDHEEEEEESVIIEEEIELPTEKPLPPVPETQQEAPDYFFGAIPETRPSMPKSRWSESTIQTLDIEITQDDDDSSDEDEDSASDSDDDEDVLTMRRSSRRAAALQTLSLNITYNRPGAPRRPPMRSLDTVDNFIRRGGWKRRGIVFHSEDVGGTPAERASF